MNLEHFKQRLEQQQQVLLTNLENSQSDKTVELDQSRMGRLTRMDAMQAQAMAQAGNRRLLAELKQIELAQQRLKNNEYGDCLQCGDNIEERRLEFNPAALYCLPCAEKNERKS